MTFKTCARIGAIVTLGIGAWLLVLAIPYADAYTGEIHPSQVPWFVGALLIGAFVLTCLLGIWKKHDDFYRMGGFRRFLIGLLAFPAFLLVAIQIYVGLAFLGSSFNTGRKVVEPTENILTGEKGYRVRNENILDN